MTTKIVRAACTGALLLAALPLEAQVADVADYRTALADARSVRLAGSGWSADGLDLGRGMLSGDSVRLTLHNTSPGPLLLGVDLRTRPGLWLTGGWQRQTGIDLGAGRDTTIVLPYRFTRTTPEAALRILVGSARPDADGRITLSDDVVRREFVLGVGNPGADDPRRDFRRLASTHLELFAWHGSLADRQGETILAEREAALQKLSEWLGVEPPERIRLVFYPDSATKTDQTGHVGAGWATNDMLVEIYSESIRLDPYHELAHIVGGALGSPPAFLDEGFATWSAERLGADALAHLGNPGRTVDEVACAHLNELFPLGDLLARDEIGGPDSRAGISYPHAASFVRFLVLTHGIERFREAWRTLAGPTDDQVRAKNVAALERIYGRPLDVLEREWRQTACGTGS